MQFAPQSMEASYIFIPMDEVQTNHLKAYGITYKVLEKGGEAFWLLNYRGGSFAFAAYPEIEKECKIRDVKYEVIPDGKYNAIVSQIANPQINQDVMKLEKAPKVAVYSPSVTDRGEQVQPWDDAVMLVLTYAEIPYDLVYDTEVLQGKLNDYDWLHLHHEDFTGQFNKLYLAYRDAPWFVAQRERDMLTARKFGYDNVPALKKAVAEGIRGFVDRGGFLFAMCGATESLDLAIAAFSVDIAGPFSDGNPPAPDADAKMAWARALAFTGAHVEPSPYINALSDIDGHQVNVPARRQPLVAFSLFGFSAKLDPVATMLVQDHRTVVPDFFGVTTSFNKAVLKPGVTVLASEDGAPWVKYIHGDYGKGSWTFLGGHDPEDAQHAIGSAPTDLSLHPNSPGYRLILNNVLFPAAKKKPRKT